MKKKSRKKRKELMISSNTAVKSCRRPIASYHHPQCKPHKNSKYESIAPVISHEKCIPVHASSRHALKSNPQNATPMNLEEKEKETLLTYDKPPLYENPRPLPRCGSNELGLKPGLGYTEPCVYTPCGGNCPGT